MNLRNRTRELCPPVPDQALHVTEVCKSYYLFIHAECIYWILITNKYYIRVLITFLPQRQNTRYAQVKGEKVCYSGSWLAPRQKYHGRRALGRKAHLKAVRKLGRKGRERDSNVLSALPHPVTYSSNQSPLTTRTGIISRLIH